MSSPTKIPYEPAPEGTPTSVSGSNISLLQTNFTLEYHRHLEAALHTRAGDHKLDLTKLPYGCSASRASKD
jgi:hypothetical protein